MTGFNYSFGIGAIRNTGNYQKIQEVKYSPPKQAVNNTKNLELSGINNQTASPDPFATTPINIDYVGNTGLSAGNAIEYVFTVEAELLATAEIAKAKTILNQLLRQIKAELAKQPNAPVGEKILAAYRVMKEQFGDWQDGEDSLFSTALNNKKLDCDTSVLVILALAEELKDTDPEWEKLGIVLIPAHAYISYNDECYDLGQKRAKEVYIQYFNLSRENAEVILAPLAEHKITFLANVNAGMYAFTKESGQKTNNFQIAENYFKQAADINNNCRVWHQLGQIAGLHAQYAEAVNYYNRALAINPNYYEALFSRGTAYYLQKDLLSARRDFQTIKELYPYAEVQELMSQYLVIIDKEMTTPPSAALNIFGDKSEISEIYYADVTAAKYPELLTLELPRSLCLIVNAVVVSNNSKSNNIPALLKLGSSYEHGILAELVNKPRELAYIEEALVDFPELQNLYLAEKQLYAEHEKLYEEEIGIAEVQRRIEHFLATRIIMFTAYNKNDPLVIGKKYSKN